MNILFVGATCFELYQVFENLKQEPNNRGPVFHYQWYNLSIDLIITGVGTNFATYQLTKALQKTKYDLVINAGIAGSFRDEISIGSVVQVISEQFADLGIEEPAKTKTIFEAGFVNPDEYPFKGGKLINPYHFPDVDLPQVRGVTSNISHGALSSIRSISERFDPDVESMEGAAVFYVCLCEKIPFIQIRSISNYVEVRNKANWDIPGAIESLTDALFRFLRTYAQIKQVS